VASSPRGLGFRATRPRRPGRGAAPLFRRSNGSGGERGDPVSRRASGLCTEGFGPQESRSGPNPPLSAHIHRHQSNTGPRMNMLFCRGFRVAQGASPASLKIVVSPVRFRPSPFLKSLHGGHFAAFGGVGSRGRMRGPVHVPGNLPCSAAARRSFVLSRALADGFARHQVRRTLTRPPHLS
jgi:hypothetical protein